MIPEKYHKSPDLSLVAGSFARYARDALSKLKLTKETDLMMNNALYNYSPIIGRPSIKWPEGARVAFYIGLNVEHFEIDKPSTSIWSGTSHLKPDPLNYGWRDYGARVGIWRLMDTFDKYRMRASVLLNSDVCFHYPEIIEAGKQRGWAW